MRSRGLLLDRHWLQDWGFESRLREGRKGEKLLQKEPARSHPSAGREMRGVAAGAGLWAGVGALQTPALQGALQVL